MTSLNIRANLDAPALKTLTNLILKFDPNATITQDIEISKDDENRLKETLKLRKEGKLQYLSFDEAKMISEARIKKR